MSYSDSKSEQYEECSFYALEENDFGLYDGSFVDNEPSYSVYTQFTFKDDDGYFVTTCTTMNMQTEGPHHPGKILWKK